MKASRHSGSTPDEKGAANRARSATPEDRTADGNASRARPEGKGDASLADLRRVLSPAAAVEPLLLIDDLGRVLACDRRTVERLRAAGQLPRPDLMIGLGARRSPRWKAATVRAWIEGGGA